MRKRVLLVDDDRDLTALLELSLSVAGYEVAKVDRGDDVLPLIAAFNPQVIVLDLMMPGMSGFDVLAEMRRRVPDPPEVVILSAHTDPDNIVAGKELGAFTFLFKPITRSKLIDSIEAALLARQQRADSS